MFLRGSRRTLVILLIIGVSALSLAVVSQPASGLVSHLPIYINGDSGFVTANGVVSGSGTASDPYVISGWEINADGDTGIEIANTNAHFVVRDVLVRSAYFGALLRGVSHATVEDSTVTASTVGIRVESSHDVTIRGASLLQNAYYGLYVLYSTDIVIARTTVESTSLDAGYLLDHTARVVFEGNTASWNPTGLYLFSSNNVTLTSSRFANSTARGFLVMYTDDVSIEGNDVWDNRGGGMEVTGSTRIVIARNRVYQNNAANAYTGRAGGIVVSSSTAAFVTDNVAMTNWGLGINLYESSGIHVTRNRADSLDHGSIGLYNTRDVVVASNNISRLHITGGTSVNVTVARNGLAFAVVSYGANHVSISRNDFNGSELNLQILFAGDVTVAQNNFVVWGSIYARHVHLDHASALTWDLGYPLGGNFWSKADKTDLCSGPNQDVCTGPDGISDRPYVINSITSDVDHYPFAQPLTRENRAPLLGPIVASPATAIPAEAITFSASYADYDGDDATYTWDFGDGATASGRTRSSLETIVGRHAYAEMGEHPVTLTVDDGNGGVTSTSSVAKVTEPGLLRVTTSIDDRPTWGVQAKMLVDGVPRDEWGLAWLKIAPGPHLVSFGDAPDLGTPADVPFVVESGRVTEVRGVYATYGWLRVLLDPALPGTISIDGVRRDDWSVWMAVPPGSYTVSFGPVAGYSRPDSIVASVVSGALTVVTGRYVRDPTAPGPDPASFGPLRVAAQIAGTGLGVQTRILVDGIPRDEWGLNWLKMTPGTHVVSFTDVPDFETPAPQTVTVVAGQTVSVTGVFLPHGWLRVTTDPPASGTIFVDGVPRDDWGMWQSMLPGTYVVSFGPLEGYLAPPPQVVAVVARELTLVVGTYTRP